MLLSRRYFAYALLSGLLLGCGGEDSTPASDGSQGQADSGNSGGGSASSSGESSQQDKDIFAKSDAEPIEVTTIDRPAVANAEEADARVKEVRDLYNQTSVPDPLQPPYSAEATRQFLEVIKFIKAQREADIAWLKSLDIDQLSGGNDITKQNLGNMVDNVLSRLEQYLPNEIKYAEEHSRDIFATNLQNDIDLVKRGADADPTKDYDVNNILTDEFDLRLRDQAIERIGSLLPLAALLDVELGVDSQWPGKMDEIRSMVAKYRSNVREAAGSVKPPADIGDAELTKIATQVLTDSAMGLPKAERIIVNFGKQQKSRTEYVVDDGTITKVVRRWDEFQAATIERANNGKYYLYFNDILYYHEGPNTVPLNKWVLGPRFQSAPILEENIGK